MTRTQSETKGLILGWAYEYARSGEFDDYITIEIRLAGDGYPEARTILDDLQIRKELNQICKENNKMEG
jgi:hypothetical protein